jgi:hypothetical protein
MQRSDSKYVVLTVATSINKYLEHLSHSVKRLGLDFAVIGLGQKWEGFGSKIIWTKQWLEANKHLGYTHFFFVDGYDTAFLKSPIVKYGKLFKDKIVFSAEKNCWPEPTLSQHYPDANSLFKYLNSGSYVSPVADWLEIVNRFEVSHADDDQLYFTKIFLQDKKIVLDYSCRIFQSYAFTDETDLKLIPQWGAIKNLHSDSYPCIVHFNGKCIDENIYSMLYFNELKEVQQAWTNTEHSHKNINEKFIERVNSVPELKALRDFVENHVYGFGERSFYWMWWLICKELPEDFKFMEIGVLKGQTLALVETIAQMQGKTAKRIGVTPLNSEGGVWDEDYYTYILNLHKEFKLKTDYKILKGLSESPSIIEAAAKEAPLDVLYIDGGHETRHITNDIDNYAHLVRLGGYLVIDDCCNNMPMPFGYFCGIEQVTKIVEDKLPLTGTREWEFIFSVVHNRVYRRRR